VKARVLFSFVQIISRVPVTFRLSIPPAVLKFLRYVQFLEIFDLFSFLGNVECLVGSDFISRLVVKVIGTLVVLVAIAISYAVFKKAWLMSSMLTLSFLVYSSVTSTLFQFLDCQTFEDGRTYLLVDPRIQCTSSYYLSTLHFIVVPMILVFTVGIPAAYYVLLRRHLKYIHPDDGLIQQKYPLISPLGTSACLLTQEHRLRDEQTSRRIENTSFLWSAYKPSYWWFECAEMFKKFLLTGLPLLTRMADGPERTEVVYGVAVGIVFAQWYKEDPYLNGTNRKLQLVCQHEITFTLLVGSMAEYAEQSAGLRVAIVVLLIGTCLPVLLFLVLAVVFPERADAALMSADDKADVRVSEQTARVRFHDGDAAGVAQALGAASMDAVRDAREFSRSEHSAPDLAVLPDDSGGPGCRRADLTVLEKLGIPAATGALWLSRGQNRPRDLTRAAKAAAKAGEGKDGGGGGGGDGGSTAAKAPAKEGNIARTDESGLQTKRKVLII